jgi:hypothetical protein
MIHRRKLLFAFIESQPYPRLARLSPIVVIDPILVIGLIVMGPMVVGPMVVRPIVLGPIALGPIALGPITHRTRSDRPHFHLIEA